MATCDRPGQPRRLDLREHPALRRGHDQRIQRAAPGPDRFHGPKNRLRLQDHPRATAVRRIVDHAMAIVRVIPEVVHRDVQDALGDRAPDNAFRHERPDHLRKDRNDVELHGANRRRRPPGSFRSSSPSIGFTTTRRTCTSTTTQISSASGISTSRAGPNHHEVAAGGWPFHAVDLADEVSLDRLDAAAAQFVPVVVTCGQRPQVLDRDSELDSGHRLGVIHGVDAEYPNHRPSLVDARLTELNGLDCPRPPRIHHSAGPKPLRDEVGLGIDNHFTTIAVGARDAADHSHRVPVEIVLCRGHGRSPGAFSVANLERGLDAMLLPRQRHQRPERRNGPSLTSNQLSHVAGRCEHLDQRRAPLLALDDPNRVGCIDKRLHRQLDELAHPAHWFDAPR